MVDDDENDDEIKVSRKTLLRYPYFADCWWQTVSRKSEMLFVRGKLDRTRIYSSLPANSSQAIVWFSSHHFHTHPESGLHEYG